MRTISRQVGGRWWSLGLRSVSARTVGGPRTPAVTTPEAADGGSCCHARLLDDLLRRRVRIHVGVIGCSRGFGDLARSICQVGSAQLGVPHDLGDDGAG